MSQLQANGGIPQKQPKYAPIYQGRFFNGINTNRSTLRAASASHIYDNNTYNSPDAFDEFRVNKAASDVFNNATSTPLENIFTMIDEAANGKLYSLTSAKTRGGNSGLAF